jgi:hypothetical protein
VDFWELMIQAHLLWAAPPIYHKKKMKQQQEISVVLTANTICSKSDLRPDKKGAICVQEIVLLMLMLMKW